MRITYFHIFSLSPLFFSSSFSSSLIVSRLYLIFLLFPARYIYFPSENLLECSAYSLPLRNYGFAPRRHYVTCREIFCVGVHDPLSSRRPPRRQRLYTQRTSQRQRSAKGRPLVNSGLRSGNDSSLASISCKCRMRSITIDQSPKPLRQDLWSSRMTEIESIRSAGLRKCRRIFEAFRFRCKTA